MHPNPAFRTTEVSTCLDFVRDRSFGSLMMNGATVPLVAHIPFLLSDDGQSADLHLVRSNPLARAAEGPTPAVLSVMGPDSYVSPDWYEIVDQVPTWNYVSVHLHGTLIQLPDSELRGVIDRLSDSFEARLLPKTVWKSSKMSEGLVERMMRAIVPFRFSVTDVQSTWKLGQNKPQSAREAASRMLKQDGIGSELASLSALMQSPPPAKTQT